MSFDPARYPADWQAIRKRLLDRSGGRCEGSPLFPECRAQNGEPHPETGSLVVLTIAHLDHDPETCRDDSRLRAWCQRCHLAYDRPRHIANRWRRRHELGADRDLFE